MNEQIFLNEAYLCSLGCGTLLRMLKSSYVVEVEKSPIDLDEKHSSTIIATKHKCRMLEGRPSLSKALFSDGYDLVEERTRYMLNAVYPEKC